MVPSLTKPPIPLWTKPQDYLQFFIHKTVIPHFLLCLTRIVLVKRPWCRAPRKEKMQCGSSLKLSIFFGFRWDRAWAVGSDLHTAQYSVNTTAVSIYTDDEQSAIVESCIIENTSVFHNILLSEIGYDSNSIRRLWRWQNNPITKTALTWITIHMYVFLYISLQLNHCFLSYSPK